MPYSTAAHAPVCVALNDSFKRWRVAKLSFGIKCQTTASYGSVFCEFAKVRARGCGNLLLIQVPALVEDYQVNGSPADRRATVNQLEGEANRLLNLSKDLQSENLVYRATVIDFYIPQLIDLFEHGSVLASEYPRQQRKFESLTRALHADLSWLQCQPRSPTPFSRSGKMWQYGAWPASEYPKDDIAGEYLANGVTVVRLVGHGLSQRQRPTHKMTSPAPPFLAGSARDVLQGLTTFCHQSIVAAVFNAGVSRVQTHLIGHFGDHTEMLESYRREGSEAFAAALHSAGDLTPAEHYEVDQKKAYEAANKRAMEHEVKR